MDVNTYRLNRLSVLIDTTYAGNAASLGAVIGVAPSYLGRLLSLEGSKSMGETLCEKISRCHPDWLGTDFPQVRELVADAALYDSAVKHLAAMDQDDADVWLATIKAAANKERRNKW